MISDQTTQASCQIFDWFDWFVHLLRMDNNQKIPKKLHLWKQLIDDEDVGDQEQCGRMSFRGISLTWDWDDL